MIKIDEKNFALMGRKDKKIAFAEVYQAAKKDQEIILWGYEDGESVTYYNADIYPAENPIKSAKNLLSKLEKMARVGAI